MAAEPRVYEKTVEPNLDKDGPNVVWAKHLGVSRFALKVLEVVLSLVAFICEEVVAHCSNCPALYFFEFMSCTALLLSLVVFTVYSTKIAEKISLERLKIWDSCFTLVVGALFLVASVVFVTGSYHSALESTSAAFGFLASFGFLIDFGLLWKKEGVLLWMGKDKPEGKTNQSAGQMEQQPLNARQA